MKKIKVYNIFIINLLISFIVSINLGFSQTADELKKVLEPSYENWKLSGKFQVFGSENLYDFINGAADNYLSYDFQELLVSTYEQPTDKYITLEIYTHKGLSEAFGIYSSEKPSDGKFETIGVQGYAGADVCNFFTGNFYVKISTHESGSEVPELLKRIAGDVARKLVKNPEFPKAISAFPAIDKVSNSESYTNTNFLGYEVLHSAFLANYKKGDKIFKLFIIELPSTDDAKTMVSGYAKSIKVDFSGLEGQQLFKDPYNGEIKLEWKGKYIWGIINDQKAKIKEDYLKLTRENLFGK